MRLTLRAMLAFQHGLLPPAEAAEIAEALERSDVARQLLARAERLAAGNGTTLGADEPQADANTLAEYLDNILPPADVPEFETRCLASDQALAELVSVHQILARVLSERAELDQELRSRLCELEFTPMAAPLLASPPPVALPLAEPIIPQPLIALPPSPPAFIAPPPLPLPPAPPTLIVPPPFPLSPALIEPPLLVLPAVEPLVLDLALLEPAAVAVLPARPDEVELLVAPLRKRLRQLTRRLWLSVRTWYDQEARYYVVGALTHILAFCVLGLFAGYIKILRPDAEAPAFDTALDPLLAQADPPALVLGDLKLTAGAQDAALAKELEAPPAGQLADAFDNLKSFMSAGDGKTTAPASQAGGYRGFDVQAINSESTTIGRSTSAGGRSQAGLGPGRPSSGRRPRERSSATGGGVVAAGGVDSAVDGILSNIRGELTGSDLLVVWLLDASLSLYDDRQQVAARIEPFYRDIDGRHTEAHLLMNAAVAFGDVTAELVPPTRFGVSIIKAVAQAPIDNTGLENVMTAVEQCVVKYRKNWKGNILIVIWTDESGDDTLQLEDTIALCRREGVVVWVVGPSSAFGSQMGVHRFIDPATGHGYLLPIKRGPDTSFAERLQLAYWHDSSLPPWSRGGAQVSDNAPWYGGPYREGLLSGVGPYALTRLALETGGKFTLLDHADNASPFTLEAMKRYLPDYASAAEYMRALHYHPLRQAVFDVVQLTYEHQVTLAPPKMSFISEYSQWYPFRSWDRFVEPGEFRPALAAELAVQTGMVQAALAVLEQGLARFGPDGMEKEYKREQSPRWRAWYDLTRGRLLAMSVRQIEYLLTSQLVVGQSAQLNADTNHIVFVPSSQLKSTSNSLNSKSDAAKRVEEAKRLLERCVEQNPDTPWASLAQWELDRPPGLEVRQVVIPRPVPSVGVPRPPTAVPSFPNL